MRHTHQTDEEQMRYADPAHDEYLAHMDEIYAIAQDAAHTARLNADADGDDCAEEGTQMVTGWIDDDGAWHYYAEPQVARGAVGLLLAEEEPSRCINCWKLKPTVRGVCAACTRDLTTIGRRSA